MKSLKSIYSWMAISLLAILAITLAGCDLMNREQSSPTEPQYLANPSDSITVLDQPQKGEKQPLVASMTGVVYIDFPFNESATLWKGADGSKTGGGWVQTNCGYINTHTGSDYYARDFTRYDGTQNGKTVYSGYSGYVVFTGDGGAYGKTVIIWNPTTHVAVRYAHMAWESTVGVGQWIGMRTAIGHVSNTGTGGGTAHLHMAAYENVANGWSTFPSCCSSTTYCCRMYAWR